MSISILFIHSAEMTPKMWSEIKRLVTGKNKHAHITFDIFANDFNHHFANISNKMNSKFWSQFFLERPKSIYNFRFKKMSNEDIKTYLGSLPNKSNNDKLGMDLVLLGESVPYISISLTNMISKSHKSGVFEQDWKNTRVTPIYKDDGDINDENNYRPISVIDHFELWNYWFFWKSIVLFQWTNLLIWKDTPPKLAFIDDWLENVNDCAITDAFLLDISKCFDSINHTIRLKKWKMYGITSA